LYQADPLSTLGSDLQGQVIHFRYRAGSNQVIPNGNIVIEFEKSISGRNIQFLPLVAVKLEAYPEGKFTKTGPPLFVICQEEGYVTVVAELRDLDGERLGGIDFNACEVKAITDKQVYDLKWDNQLSVFTAQIPLSDEQIKFSVSAKYKGYFDFLSNIFTIESEPCVSYESEIKVDKTLIRAKVTEMDLAPSVRIDPFIIEQPSGNQRPPTEEEFKDLDLVKTGGGRIGVDVKKEDGYWMVKPSEFWCACFTSTGKDSLVLTMESDDSRITPTGDQVVIQVEIEDVSFWKKCGWLFIVFGVFLILLWYIIGLLKKPRFRKASEIEYFKSKPHGFEKKKMSRESFGLPRGFIARYLIPYRAESRSIDGITFKATRSSSVVLSKKSQKENMFIGGNEIDEPGRRDIKLTKGEVLEIRERNFHHNYRYDIL
jgi:hypothetical protein